MISFNSNNLESAYLIINKVNKFGTPDRDIYSETLSFQDGFEVLRDYWRSRTIKIEGMLDATSSAHLASQIDTLKQNLSGVNKNLDVDYGGATRRYKATLSGLEAPEDFYNITHLPYGAEFLCQPFGYGTSTISIAASDVTASSHTETFTVTGTYKPLPTISITFTAESGASSVSVTTGTGDVILIETAFTANDVLAINCEAQKVTLNGTQIDFSGPIPAFTTGSNTVDIAVISTSHTYDLSIDYIPRYL